MSKYIKSILTIGILTTCAVLFFPVQGEKSDESRDIGRARVYRGVVPNRNEARSIVAKHLEKPGPSLSESGRAPDAEVAEKVDLVVQNGHVREVRCLAATPDGKMLISFDETGAVKLWEIETGRLLRNFRHDRANPGQNQLAISPDGSFFATGADDGLIKVWDPQSKEPMETLSGDKGGRISGLAVDRLGRVLFSTCDSGCELWNVHDGKLLAKSQEEGGYSGLASDPEGNFRVLASNNIFFKEHFAGGGSRLKGEMPYRIVSLKASPSGKLIAVADAGGDIEVRRASDLGLVEKFRFDESDRFIGETVPLAISPDDRTLIAGNSDIRVWDLYSEFPPVHVKEAHNRMTSVAFEPSGKYFFSGGMNGEIRMWETKTGKPVKMFPALAHDNVFMAETIDRIVSDPEFTRLLAGFGNNRVSLWDLETLAMSNTIETQKTGDAPWSFRMAPRGKVFATSHGQGVVKLWSMLAGSLMHELVLDLPYASTSWFDFTPDGNHILIVREYTGGNFAVSVVSVETGRDEARVDGYDGVAIDPGGKFFAAKSVGSYAVDIRELPSGRLVHSVDTGVAAAEYEIVETKDFAGQSRFVPEEIQMMVASPCGRRILVLYYTGRMDIVDTETGGLTKDFRERTSILYDNDVDRLSFDDSGGYVVYRGIDNGGADVWNAKTGKKALRIDGHVSTIFKVFIEPEKGLAVAVSDDRATVWSLKTQKLVFAMEGRGFENAFVDTTWRYLAVQEYERCRILDLSYGAFVETLPQEGDLYSMTVSEGETSSRIPVFVCRSDTGKIEFVDPFERKPVADPSLAFDRHSSNATHMLIRGKFLAEVRDGIETRIVNVENGSVVSLVDSGSEWISYTPDGCFDSSRHGGSLLAIVKGLEAYGPDQFALVKNRPDLMLRDMDLGSEKIREYFYRRHLKHLKKFGLESEAAISVGYEAPEAEISSVRQEGKTAILSCGFRDDSHSLKSYNIYVDDVPLFPGDGKPISGHSASATETFELTSGSNTIEASCINAAGVESFRARTRLEYDDKTKPDLYYAGFGVSEYADSSLNLKYADNDAEDLGILFSSMKGAFGDIRVRAFVNGEAGKENIEKAADFLAEASVDDVVVLFFAGHGVHDNDPESTCYFLPHDADLSRLGDTGISCDDIERLLSKTRSRKKVLLLDTCESGEVDDQASNLYFAKAESRGISPRTSRTVVAKFRLLDPNSERFRFIDKNRFVYNDLVRRTGAVVFSSSGGNEFSYESDEFENGFFTESLISTIMSASTDKDENRCLSIGEILAETSAAVAEMSEGLQHPAVDRENIHQKIEFPVVGALVSKKGKNGESGAGISPETLHWHIDQRIVLFSLGGVNEGVLRGVSDKSILLDRGSPGRPEHLSGPHSNFLLVKLASDISPDAVSRWKKSKYSVKAPTRGLLPMMDAAAGNDVGRLESLVSAGGEVNAATYNGRTALSFACQAGAGKAVRWLLDRGAKVDETTLDGLSPLYYAVGYGFPGIAKILLERGAKANRIDGYGTPLLHVAVGGRDDPMVADMLLEKGADIDAVGENGYFALHVAAYAGNSRIVSYLVGKGMDVDARESFYDYTPLHVAAGAGKEACVGALLELGADANAKNSMGQTALDILEKLGNKGSKDIMSMLEKAGGRK